MLLPAKRIGRARNSPNQKDGYVNQMSHHAKEYTP